jgi:hypothetical protein
MVRAVAAATATLFVVALLAAAAVQDVLTGLLGGPPASAAAPADIPPAYLTLYQQAAGDCPGLDWTVLAAIGKIETDHGRSPLPGVTSGQNSAGAAGPMQILQPTFNSVLARHALPPGGAVPPSRYDPHDAVHAASFELCDHGAPTDLPAAVYAYNHSSDYVAAVLAQADRYRQSSPVRTDWPSEPAIVPDPSGTGGHVTPRTATIYHVLAAAGALRAGGTCWDPHLQNPGSDHPLGKACDLFFHPDDPADVARGWALARWLVTQQATYGVHYLIWQGLIWSTEHPTWTTYRSDIYGCPNPTHITGCHFDHIHLSLF